jgi:hypothetical protein
MSRLRIAAGGNSQHARAQARGVLFEKLMADVLRHHGYKVERNSRVNYAGMEIDIEGIHILSHTPLYAECKCHDTDVDAPQLQAFLGKYMSRWLKDKRTQGLFIALPGINSHAMGFYRENLEGNHEISVRLLQELEVLDAVYELQNVVRPEVIASKLGSESGVSGDSLILYTDKGIFWVQFVIPRGAAIPQSVALFDGTGNPITDPHSIDHLTNVCPELNEYGKVFFEESARQPSPPVSPEVEQVVEVRGSSECFEYQFPASPQFFVGRDGVLAELDAFVNQVVNKEISARGVLFTAHSGWGKSSVVLAGVARLAGQGHFTIAVDSRSASSSQFILRVVDQALRKFGDFAGLRSVEEMPKSISGFEGAFDGLLQIGRRLEARGKVMCIFLDQFENLFFLPEILKKIAELMLRLSDAATNILIGFSWKTDLVGQTAEFPYRLRDQIAGNCKIIPLDLFSDRETNALLDKLSNELRTHLRKDLRFFLSEFSQGYPWLLKKLCAHVKGQRQAGVSQLEIANRLLIVQELFKEDLSGLSPAEHSALHHIARVAPVSYMELGDELQPEVIQSLVDRRLVVSIGSKLDIYWDIFRDFLNTGHVPVEENYVLRISTRSVLRGVKLIVEWDGEMTVADFLTHSRLTQRSSYNLFKEMALLGFAGVDGENVRLIVNLPRDTEGFENTVRLHLGEKLRKNRIVGRLLESLSTTESLTLDQISQVLRSCCPYIPATDKTWLVYARTIVDWMDLADLAIFDHRRSILTRYKPGRQIRSSITQPKRGRGTETVILIQYSPVARVLMGLIEAFNRRGRLDLSGMKKSTLRKALGTLEDLDFISQEEGSIVLHSKMLLHLKDPNELKTTLAEAIKGMHSFGVFMEVLMINQLRRCTIKELGAQLRNRLNAEWTDGTATINAKIMLDWARHTDLAPKVFSKSRRDKVTPTLFE